MNCAIMDSAIANCSALKDIWIPLICALFGGLVTFLGLFITIKHENKKSRQEYIERIRPFIVVDSFMTSNADSKHTIDVYVNTEADREEMIEGVDVYRFMPFLFTNCGEAVFIVDYLKINNRKYECVYKTSIKPNDSAQVAFRPIEVFQISNTAKDIRIGISDRQSNQYEYEMIFEITDNTIQDSLARICKKSITVKSVDCRKNLYNKRNKKILSKRRR